MAQFSEKPLECSIRPAANRTKFSVRFCGLPQCHPHWAFSSSHLLLLCAWMPVQTLPRPAKLQICFLKSRGGGYFSLFTEVLLHVLSNCASTSIALLKLKLKLCPADDAASSSAKVGTASWTGSPTADQRFGFRFNCLEKEEKQDGEENETERGRETDYGLPTRKVFCCCCCCCFIRKPNRPILA